MPLVLIMNTAVSPSQLSADTRRRELTQPLSHSESNDKLDPDSVSVESCPSDPDWAPNNGCSGRDSGSDRETDSNSGSDSGSGSENGRPRVKRLARFRKAQATGVTKMIRHTLHCACTSE